jgi:hypothetical protein
MPFGDVFKMIISLRFEDAYERGWKEKQDLVDEDKAKQMATPTMKATIWFT